MKTRTKIGRHKGNVERPYSAPSRWADSGYTSLHGGKTMTKIDEDYEGMMVRGKTNLGEQWQLRKQSWALQSVRSQRLFPGTLLYGYLSRAVRLK